MPPKRGKVYKDDLVDRLQDLGFPVDAEADLQELLDLALENDLVTADEYEKTQDVRHVTRKCYLRRLVRDERLLELLDAYVVASSQIRSAGYTSSGTSLRMQRTTWGGWMTGTSSMRPCSTRPL